MASSCSFVLLAGGRSSRMGLAKGLLKYKQTYWILEQLQRIQHGGITTVYVGLGHDPSVYFTAIPWFIKALAETVAYGELQLRVVVNPNPEFGPFSTLQAVLNAVGTNEDILVCPVDVPICDADALKAIKTTDNGIVLPAYNNKHGHPVKIAAEHWIEFKKLAPNNPNARLDYQIKRLDSKSISVRSVNDPQVIMNLNSVEDWKAFIEQ